MSETVIETVDLGKEFRRDSFHIVALRDVNIQVDRGEFVAESIGEGTSLLDCRDHRRWQVLITFMKRDAPCARRSGAERRFAGADLAEELTAARTWQVAAKKKR